MDEKARLESPVVEQGPRYCVDFWFHMYGADIGALNVYVRANGSDDLGDPLWTRSQTLDDLWYRGFFPVSRNDAFQVCVEWWMGLRAVVDLFGESHIRP